MEAIWAKCGPLNQHQRAAIGLTRRDKKSGPLTLPGYDALNDIVNQVNPNSLAHAINQWLAANSDILPKTLAFDGKDLGGKDWITCPPSGPQTRNPATATSNTALKPSAYSPHHLAPSQPIALFCV